MQDMHFSSSTAQNFELQTLRLLAERASPVLQDTMLWQVRLAGRTPVVLIVARQLLAGARALAMAS